MDSDDKQDGNESWRVQLVRVQEKLAYKAERDEMHTADIRILQEVSSIFDRTSSVQREYVRDRVRESALETNTALAGVKGDLQTLTATVISLTEAINGRSNKGGVHPILSYGGGGLSGAGLLYLILQFAGQIQHG